MCRRVLCCVHLLLILCILGAWSAAANANPVQPNPAQKEGEAPKSLTSLLPGLQHLEGAFCRLGDMGKNLLKSFSGVAIGGAVGVPQAKNLVGAGCDLAFLKKNAGHGHYKIGMKLGCFPELRLGKVKSLEADVDLFFGCDPPSKMLGYGVHFNAGGYSIKAQVGDRPFEKIAEAVTGNKMPQGESFDDLASKLDTARRKIQGSLTALKKSPEITKLVLGSFKEKITSYDGSPERSAAEVMSELMSLHQSHLDRLSDTVDSIRSLRKQLGEVTDPNAKGVVRSALAARLASAQETLEELNDVLARPLALNFISVSPDGYVPKKSTLNQFKVVPSDEYFQSLWDFKEKYGMGPYSRPILEFPPRFPPVEKGYLFDKEGNLVGSIQDKGNDRFHRDWRPKRFEIPAPLINGFPPNISQKLFGKGSLGVNPEFVVPKGPLGLEPLFAVPKKELDVVEKHFGTIASASADVYAAMKGTGLINEPDVKLANKGMPIDPNRKAWSGPKSSYMNGCFSISIPMKHLIEGAAQGVYASIATALPILANLGSLAMAGPGVPKLGREIGREIGKLVSRPVAAGLEKVGHGAAHNFQPDRGELYGGLYHVYRVPGVDATFPAPDVLNTLFDRIDSATMCNENAPGATKAKEVAHGETGKEVPRPVEGR